MSKPRNNILVVKMLPMVVKMYEACQDSRQSYSVIHLFTNTSC